MKDKISKKMADERSKRVQPKSSLNLPKTNKDLFLKLKDQESGGVATKKKQRQVASNLLADDRFSAMFTDDRYQVDQNDEAFRLLNPVLTQLDSEKKKELEKKFSSIDNNPNDSEEEDEGVVLATGEGALVLLPPPPPQEIRKNTRRKERVLIKLK